MCKHSCHLRKELKAAADAAGTHVHTGTTSQPARPSPSSCTACWRSRSPATTTGTTTTASASETPRWTRTGVALERVRVLRQLDEPHGSGKQRRTYRTRTPSRVHRAERARRAPRAVRQRRVRAPPPPAPPIYRNDARRGRRHDQLSAQVCAATLQYGLFEQGRLFGIPDVIAPFVVDNRVDRGLHFMAKWIYDAMYVNPEEGGRHPGRPQVEARDVHCLPPLEHVHLGHPGGQRRGVHARARRSRPRACDS